jgi:hypothetical protein
MVWLSEGYVGRTPVRPITSEILYVIFGKKKRTYDERITGLPRLPVRPYTYFSSETTWGVSINFSGLLVV